MKKRLLSMLLVLVMMLGILPVTAMADNEAPWELGDTFESDNPEATLPTAIPEGTKWSGPVEELGEKKCTEPDHVHGDGTCDTSKCRHQHDKDCYSWTWEECTNPDHWRKGTFGGEYHIDGTDCKWSPWYREWGQSVKSEEPDQCDHHHSTRCCGKHVHTDDCYKTLYVWTLVDANHQSDGDQWRNWWPVFWDYDNGSSVSDPTGEKVTVTAGPAVDFSNGTKTASQALSATTANTGNAIQNGFHITVAEGYYLTQYRLVCGNHSGCGVVRYSDSIVLPNSDGNYTSTITYHVTGENFNHWKNIGGLPSNYPTEKPTGDNLYSTDYWRRNTNTIYPFYLMVEIAEDPTEYRIDYSWGVLAEQLNNYAVPASVTGLKRNAERTVSSASDAAIRAALSAGYIFDGWSVSGKGYDDDATVRPGNTVTIYGSDVRLTAKWKPVPKYTVSYAWGTGVTAPEGAVLPDPQTFAENTQIELADLRGLPTANGYNISGWYTDAACTTPVTAFTIKENVTLYAKAEISTAAYSVKYYKDAVADGNYLGEESGTKNIGETVTVDKTKYAPAGYAVPGTAYKDSLIIVADAALNVATVVYSKRTDLSYTVNYLEKDTNKVLAAAKTVNNQTFGAKVTESAIDIAGYNKVEQTSQEITIAVGGNVINFYYTARTDLSYTVNYLEKDTNKVLAAAKTVNNQTFGAKVTESAIDIAGYNKVEPTSQEITIAVGGKVINFYYTARTDLSYTVNYYLEGTTTSVAPSKTVDGQTFGASVTEHAKEIEDYILVGEATKTITIAVSGNVINFFYKFDAKPGLKVEKDVYAINNVLVDANKSYTVNANDVVTWKITVSNEGNVALRGVSVEDTLTIGKTSVALKLYDADGNQVTSLYLAAKGEDGAVKVLYASYKVTAKDQGYKLANTVVADAGDNGPKDSDTNDDFKVKDAIVYVPTLNKKDHVAYIIGYEDDTVRPENNITRAEVATIFFRLLTDDSRARFWSQTNAFSDVSSSDWFNNAVSTMANAGILTGYPDGTFKPNAPITRAEFAAIAARFSDVSYNGSCSFTDVAKTHWAADEIALAEHLGWITGYPDDTFRPSRNITRAEAMTLINRVLERAVEEDHMHKDMVKWIDNSPSAWYYEDVQEATNSHVYTRLSRKVPGQSFCYEDWTGILKAPDWAALEKSWSDANDR